MFKRATRELAKQSIGADDFDPEAIEEVLAGVSSDESDDDSDMETTPSIKATNENKRKIDAAQEDYDSSDEESEDDMDKEEEDSADLSSDDDDVEDEMELVYTCNICPDRRLTSEKLLNEHLQSKIHLRRQKIAAKAENLKKLTPKEREKRKEQLEKTKLLREEKNRKLLKAKRAAKKAKAYLRQHPEAANNKVTKATASSKNDQPSDTKVNNDKLPKDKKVKVNKSMEPKMKKAKIDSKSKVKKSKD